MPPRMITGISSAPSLPAAGLASPGGQRVHQVLAQPRGAVDPRRLARRIGLGARHAAAGQVAGDAARLVQRLGREGRAVVAGVFMEADIEASTAR